MNPEIFRAYDIRGIADRDLTDAVAESIGRAVGTRIRRAGGASAALGRDCRVSGTRLRDAVARGLAAAGLEVFDVGMVPTPVLYFTVFHRELGGGIQITGSHNPAAFNGFKMLVGKEALHGDQIRALADQIAGADFESGEGRVIPTPILGEYEEWIASRIRMGTRPLHIVVDGGNGVAGPSAVALFRRLGCRVSEYFIEPDGTFPNHEPDPTTTHSAEILRNELRETGADLAIGLDGDGDRIGVVDGNGETLWGDRLMILFSRAVLREEPGATIVSEVKCSKTLFDDIAAHGGRGIMAQVGHSLIKAKMKETGALLAGEMSGHIFFRHRYFGFDDATYAGARLLEILSNSTSSISEMLSDVPRTFATPEIRIDCPDRLKFGVVQRIVEHLKRDHDVVDIDGARVNFPDGWGLIRASNTQPVVVMRAEATTAERRDEIQEFLADLVRRFSAESA